MSQRLQPSSGFLTPWFSSWRLWKLLTPREAGVVAALQTIALIVFHRSDGFEQFSRLVASFEAFELDEVLFVILLTGMAALGLTVRRTVELQREVVERTRAEQRALELAHDPLTGLPQRRLLLETTSAMVSDGKAFTMLLIDLDKFKPINDLHGHEIGDMVLVHVSEQLRQLDPGLYVSRLGGDEFICLMASGGYGDDGGRLAGSIVDRISQPVTLAGRSVTIGATVGIARFPKDGCDAKSLLRASDLAMYSAKRLGRRTYAHYHPSLAGTARQRAQLELEVRAALCDGQIRPYFQSVLDVAKGGVSGFEALARWEHPERGLIEPAAFIPIIDNLGLADELLEVILRHSAEAARTWAADAALRVNVCASQVQQELFAAKLLSTLRTFDLDARRLIIEVTEDALVGDVEQVAATFAQLRAAGVRMALDDFGRSYSNLALLRELKFDHLKIHGSFLRMADRPDGNVLNAMLALARELDMPAIAQRVETERQAAMLGALGCSQAQGFYFSRVSPAQRVAGAFRREHPHPPLSRGLGRI